MKQMKIKLSKQVYYRFYKTYIALQRNMIPKTE